jgi:competence protein ComEA
VTYTGAAVDPERAPVNTAFAHQLKLVAGIGVKTAAAIIKERSEHGPFKDAADLMRRVKGVKPSVAATFVYEFAQ